LNPFTWSAPTQQPGNLSSQSRPLILRLLIMLLTISLLLSNRVNARSITIGSLSDSADSEIALFLPLAAYLSTALTSFDIDKGRVRIKRNHDQMANLMKRGEVDLFIDSSVSALKMQRLGAGEFFLRRWKQGIAEYQGVIFTLADSPITQINDLAGRTIGFEERFSSSGYLLPASELSNNGLLLSKDPIGTHLNQVNSRFTGSDQSTLMWVLHKRIDAGAMASNTFKELAGDLIGEFKIIHTSATVPYHVILIRPGISERLQTAIKYRLMAMEQNLVGQQVLQGFEQTSRFDEIPSQAISSLSHVHFGSSQ